MREHKEIKINSIVVWTKEKQQSLKCEGVNIVVSKGLINHSELLEIYMTLNSSTNKHRVRIMFRKHELKIQSHSWIPTR